MRPPDRIAVDPPASGARRDRVERAVFARLASIRADGVVRGAERPARRGRAAWIGAAVAIAAAAAAAVVVVVVRGAGASGPGARHARELVVTPVGGASRFTVGDAVIDAGSDTSVEVRPGEHDALTLVLERGRVDCDVAPRGHRPPFRVVAADVTVEVVGTRFGVERRGRDVRVDVTRGKVRVIDPSGERLVAAGEAWSSAATATVPAAPPGPAAPPVQAPATGAAARPAPAAAPPAAAAPRSRRQAFDDAQRLEARDPAAAARAYQRLASGDGEWAALALFSLADVDANNGHAAAALEALDAYAHRFPHGVNSEDAAWLRVDALRTLGRGAAARRAAADYVRRFPGGTYAAAARRLVGTRP